MIAWILSIVGIVIVGVLIDVMIPDGQLNKYIKGVYAIITVFVIASPLPNLISGQVEWGEFFSITQPEVDEAYIANTHQMQIYELQQSLEQELQQTYEIESEITIDYTTQDYQIIIIKTTVAIKEQQSITSEIEQAITQALQENAYIQQGEVEIKQYA